MPTFDMGDSLYQTLMHLCQTPSLGGTTVDNTTAISSHICCGQFWLYSICCKGLVARTGVPRRQPHRRSGL